MDRCHAKEKCDESTHFCVQLGAIIVFGFNGRCACEQNCSIAINDGIVKLDIHYSCEGTTRMNSH